MIIRPTKGEAGVLMTPMAWHAWAVERDLAARLVVVGGAT